MPTLKDQKLELYCQERAKIGATDIGAYLAAGYDVKKVAEANAHIMRILKDERISTRIREIHVEAVLGSGATPEKIRRQLAYAAFANITKIIQWGDTVVRTHVDKVTGEIRVVNVRENWIRVVDSEKIDPCASAAIKEISRNAKGTVMRVTLRDPMPALIAAGKDLGMWSKHTRHNSQHYYPPPAGRESFVDRGPPETREEWEARVKRRIDAELNANQKEAVASVENTGH